MNTLALSFAALALALPSYAAEPVTIDWNSTTADVRSAETLVPQDISDTRITYEVEFKGAQYHQEYLFGDQGTLVNVLYYKSFPADGDDCLAEYRRIRQVYLSDLGDVKLETTLDDSLAAGYGDGHICKGVSEGKLAASTEWPQSDGTLVSVELSVWKGQPYVGISSAPVGTD